MAETDDGEDFNFIDEIVSGHMKDLDQQEKIHNLVENALEDKNNLNSEYKEDIIGKVETCHDNFIKVLTYAGFLLEQIKSTKSDLKKESHQKAIAVDEKTRLQE